MNPTYFVSKAILRFYISYGIQTKNVTWFN